MTARSRALAILVLVAVALGLGAGVAAADDIGTQDDVTVHLVGDEDEDNGLDTIALFEDEVPETYDIEYINVTDVDPGVIGETDIFVFYSTDEDEDLITTVEGDSTTGAVYLDQQSDLRANGISDRSVVTGDPEETDDTLLGDPPVEYNIEEGHPIFEGVAEENETVQITDGEENHAWFGDADIETLATVGLEEDDEPSGSSVAVDPETGSVLLSSIAVEFAPALEDFTPEAGEILGNAVEFAEPDTEEPSFEVDELDAPPRATTGSEIDVSATVTNIGTETGTQDVEFVFDNETIDTEENITLDPGENVTLTFDNIPLPEEIGLFEHGVFTDDDSQTAEIGVGVEFVGVVESFSEGAETATLFADELPDRFVVEVVDSEDVVEDGLVEFYDILVFHDFGFEDEEEIIPAVENDVTTGAVYLDQDGSTSDAITDRSDVIGDPESTDDGITTEAPVAYELVQPDHPIFDGIDAPDDVFEIHGEDEVAWFGGASGETLAGVVDGSGEAGGDAVAIDPESGSVLLSSIATTPAVGPSQFTEAANQTLANAVEVAEPGSFFEVSELDAPAQAGAGTEIEVNATITNTGVEADTQDVEFVFDGDVVITEENVTLEPEADTTVAFTDVGLPEEGGIFEHGVFTDDDNETAEINVTNPPEIELSDLDIAGEGENATVLEADHEVSVEMTHVGGGAGEVDTTLSIGDTVEETTTVDIAENETTGVTFENVTTGLGPGIYEVEMMAQDETRTGELTISVDVVGDGDPATDTTGDGLLDDLTGDGQSGIEDVQALFETLDSDAIQDNVELFDFLGDDRVTIFDVQALFTDLE